MPKISQLPVLHCDWDSTFYNQRSVLLCRRNSSRTRLRMCRVIALCVCNRLVQPCLVENTKFLPRNWTILLRTLNCGASRTVPGRCGATVGRIPRLNDGLRFGREGAPFSRLRNGARYDIEPGSSGDARLDENVAVGLESREECCGRFGNIKVLRQVFGRALPRVWRLATRWWESSRWHKRVGRFRCLRDG
jgi:hypothetical protein